MAVVSSADVRCMQVCGFEGNKEKNPQTAGGSALQGLAQGVHYSGS
jgi:hypothetical protein